MSVPWEYYFYTEIEGDLSAEASQELLKALSDVCKTVRVLGAFTRRKEEDTL